MLPPHLMAEFWATVKQELRRRHELDDKVADEAIDRFQTALGRHRVGDLVYHRFPESVAETIAGGWKSNFPDPLPR